MDHFHYVDGQLCAEQVPLTHIAELYGTPCYVYSRATLERHWHAFHDAFVDYPHLICYAVKANPNLAVLNILARLGSGFDVVSIGELERVVLAGGDTSCCVFSGVGKHSNEILRALQLGILCFNVESEAELHVINAIAKSQNCIAPISLRINPNVNANTHPYISTGLRENKFGIAIDDARLLYQQAASWPQLRFIGVDCHIGSQLTQLEPFLEALDHLLALIDELAASGIALSHVDLGGGLGVTYHDETPPHPREFAQAIKQRLAGRSIKIILEPGRAIAANAGVLLTQVNYLKQNDQKHFAIVDAAMNDLLRPALYQSWHSIIPVIPHARGTAATFDIVGPVCETGDFLAKDRTLNLAERDLLAIRTAGAYGFTMSSNYNSRPRAAEVMVDGAQHYCVRARESLADLWRGESLLPKDETN